jgi:predicted nucleic acid-binding protein
VIAYVDSSVFMRVLLRQPMALPEWDVIELPLTSALLRVESCRTLDRATHRNVLTDTEYAAKLAQIETFVSRSIAVRIDEPLMLAASRRLPVRLSTLDAIHLASAEHLRETFRDPFVFATHDRELAAAARASGFEVIGSTP